MALLLPQVKRTEVDIYLDSNLAKPSHNLMFVPKDPQPSQLTNAPQVAMPSSSNHSSYEGSGDRPRCDRKPQNWTRVMPSSEEDKEGILLSLPEEDTVLLDLFWEETESEKVSSGVMDRVYEDVLREASVSKVMAFYGLHLTRLQILHEKMKNDLRLTKQWRYKVVNTRKTKLKPRLFFKLKKDAAMTPSELKEGVAMKARQREKHHTVKIAKRMDYSMARMKRQRKADERGIMQLLEQCEDVLIQSPDFDPEIWQPSGKPAPRWIQGRPGWTGLVPDDVKEPQA